MFEDIRTTRREREGERTRSTCALGTHEDDELQLRCPCRRRHLPTPRGRKGETTRLKCRGIAARNGGAERRGSRIETLARHGQLLARGPDPHDLVISLVVPFGRSRRPNRAIGVDKPRHETDIRIERIGIAWRPIGNRGRHRTGRSGDRQRGRFDSGAQATPATCCGESEGESKSENRGESAHSGLPSAKTKRMIHPSAVFLRDTNRGVPFGTRRDGRASSSTSPLLPWCPSFSWRWQLLRVSFAHVARRASIQ